MSDKFVIGTSEDMDNYFEALTSRTNEAYELASKARAQGLDPESKVDIPLARNMAERVEGLISAAAPQLIGKGVPQRIQELEHQYKPLSWEVALLIAEEVAKEKFCTFKDKKEAMEIGIRTGFAYHTVGIVSAPLEGFVELQIKKRKDGREYLAMSYAGPIRGAGGTAAAFSVVLADYIRKVMGYEPYDPDENEVNRYYVELEDYHERVTNLQYHPTEKETKYLAGKLPVEITGDPTEKLDVSNYKDLPRIPTNKIRGGMCLVFSMVALKTPKVWKELQKWGNSFGLSWDFLGEFMKIQKEIKAGLKKEKKEESHEKPKVLPDNTFIVDLVGGRPVLTHPLAHGGFRLRYGRSRVSGYSAACIHPATMAVLDDYVAIGTQLKVERPGKAAAIAVCDSIEGPTVLLDDGSVVYLDSHSHAKAINPNVNEILYLGDMLFSYGDFFDRNHPLIPCGYCEEWHSQDVEKAITDKFESFDLQKAAESTTLNQELISNYINNPLYTKISAKDAINLAEGLNVPLHPKYTYHWNTTDFDSLTQIYDLLLSSSIEQENDVVKKLIIPVTREDPRKRIFELLGLPHLMATEDIVIEKDNAEAFLRTLGVLRNGNIDKDSIPRKKQLLIENKEESVLKLLEFVSGLKIKDKSGTFVGARMGRPEKAKMRKLIGAPHVLFPVGEQGGRMKSIQSVLEHGFIEADFPLKYCNTCSKESIFGTCEYCGSKTEQRYYCNSCGIQKTDTCSIHGKNKTHAMTKIDFQRIYDGTLKKIKATRVPDLIKGVKGTSNRDRYPEHLAKGILRAHNDIAVNKDGTTRYDMSEVPITHFKPKEVGTSVKKLRELGYLKDIRGSDLVSDDQVLELKPQDIILPGEHNMLDAPATEVLFNVASFVDDLLENFYGLERYYNAKSTKDLVGHLVIGLAPHTSAGTLGRIIGFSKTAGMLCHPLYHAAMRRDCDGDESCVMLLMDALLNFSRQFLPDNRGGRTMDAPLVLTAILNPAEVDDMVHKLDIVWKYPREFYEACEKITPPGDVDIKRLGAVLGTPYQYEGMGFTHDVSDFNEGTACSAYKTLPTIDEKLQGQMKLAKKIRAVNTTDVARLVIEKHFMKDTRGNLRKFSMQKFRCSNCNESYRRTPLIGKCTKCGGKLIFTISEGSIVKYLEPSIELAEKYGCDDYLKDSLYLIRYRLEAMFGREKEKQTGLGNWVSQKTSNVP